MKLKILNIVALLKAIPEKHLAKGEAYALLTLPAENLLLLKHEPEMMA